LSILSPSAPRRQISKFARAKRAALRFSFISQMFGVFRARWFAPGAKGAVISTSNLHRGCELGAYGMRFACRRWKR
jgi:hypothetical protein